MQRAIAQDTSAPAAVPAHVGISLAFGYMLFHSLWARVVFGEYSFVLCRAVFLGCALAYLVHAVGIRLGDLARYVRLPHKRDGWFVLGLFVCTIGARFCVQRFYEHYWPGSDHLAVTFEAVIDNCLVAPVSEEPIFRGLMLVCLAPVFGERSKGLVVLSAIAFASAHSISSFLPVAVLGAILALAFLRTGSLPLCIGLHAVWNAMVFL